MAVLCVLLLSLIFINYLIVYLCIVIILFINYLCIYIY